MARLKSGTSVEDLKTAVDGAARAAHVDEAGVKHDDLELICRSAEKLDLFIARASSTAVVRQTSGRDSAGDLIDQMWGREAS
jgi:hypothetical protein